MMSTHLHMRRNPLRLGFSLLRVGLAELASYRAEVIIWILTTTMPLIMYNLWAALAETAPLSRFDRNTFAAYFLSTLVVRQLASSWVVWELNSAIRMGSLSSWLLRPLHPLWYFAAQNLAIAPFRFLVLLPVVAVALFAMPSMLDVFEPGRLHLYLWTIFCAWLLTFLVQAMIGLLALFTDQSLSIQDAWLGLWSLFSGYLIPIDLMPSISGWVRWLPFRAMGSMPTEILLGHIDDTQIVTALLIQLGWIALFTLALIFVWQRALRHFEAYGG